MTEDSTLFERNLARLLIVLYCFGQPVNSLLDGETRQVDSLWKLQYFDFWVREPGHLALALLHLLANDTAKQLDSAAIRAIVDRLIADDQADLRRVALPGAPYNVLEDFDYALSYLTARALVSDRPSFGKTRSASHQVILESAGIAVVQKILETCPLFDWYKVQAETVAKYFPLLEPFDLAEMPYLAPDLTAAQAASDTLLPAIRNRYARVFPATSAAADESPILTPTPSDTEALTPTP